MRSKTASRHPLQWPPCSRSQLARAECKGHRNEQISSHDDNDQALSLDELEHCEVDANACLDYQ
jgi:hypothetical protein